MAIRINKYENTSNLQKPNYKSYSKMNNYSLLIINNKYELGYYQNIIGNYQADETDNIFIITPEYEYRMDLISQKFYGSPVYDWILEDINGIEDPIKDLTVGTKIIIPNFNKIV